MYVVLVKNLKLLECWKLCDVVGVMWLIEWVLSEMRLL